ncbi:MAG: uroporphyrinogen-III synthase [Granulosicoccaceae bacterium]
MAARPTVLVTRPAHQAETFCRLLDEAGFEPLRCPTVDIAPVEKSPLLCAQLEELKSADIAVFTSANAVHFAQLLRPLSEALHPHADVLAVGPATAKALESCGVKAKLPQREYSSQGLMLLPELKNVAGKSVFVVRGVGGLPTLPDALNAAGAQLQLLECYKRQLPANASLLKQLFHTELPQIISSTSNESLSNLVTLASVEERPRLWQLPLIVNSERGEHLARSLGFSADILRASPVGDHGQISTLKAWITQRLTQR